MKSQYNFIIAAVLLFTTACTQPKTENGESKSTSNQEVTKVESLVVSPAEFKEKMSLPGVQIIDVRTDGEVAQGMIPNAVQMNLMDREKFMESVKSLDREKPVLVYCQSGARSAKAASYLVEQGFKQIYDLQGGFSNWIENKGEVQIPQ